MCHKTFRAVRVIRCAKLECEFNLSVYVCRKMFKHTKGGSEGRSPLAAGGENNLEFNKTPLNKEDFDLWKGGFY